MKTDTKTETKLSHVYIEKECKNFKLISDDIRNSKFEHIDTWVLKTSIQFKKENKSSSIFKYPRFDYGTIIKADFGINLGSELSGPHFAITLDKFDSTKNPVITVLPLSSQNKKYYLPLSDLITDEFIKRLQNYLTKLLNETDVTTENSSIIVSPNYAKLGEINLLNNMFKYYSNYAKSSYACINQITTISKDKILSPKNQFDIIGRAKCSSKTMKIISSEIAKKFMKFDN